MRMQQAFGRNKGVSAAFNHSKGNKGSNNQKQGE